PLAQRLKAEGRLLVDDWADEDFSHQVKAGATNFRPLHMTAEELSQGQRKLIGKLYEPAAFRERLLGNLGRFHDVRCRPVAMSRDNLLTMVRLAGFFWGQGGQGRSFLGKALWSTLRRSPRCRVTMATLLGKYYHILRLNGLACA